MVSVEVELWMHPTCSAAVAALRRNRLSAEAEMTVRTLALFDALVEKLRRSGEVTRALAELRPRSLATITYPKSQPPGWPSTAEGRAIEQSSRSTTLCSYQVDQLRSIVAVVDCVQEMFVVWLSATLTRPARPDGFIDDTDAAQATQALWSSLGHLLDLTWLERE